MYNFQCRPEQLKDCINQTEMQLRDLISTTLSSKYGFGWEISKQGFSVKKRPSLEQKCKDEQDNLPNQKVSDRLVDYSNFLDLWDLIEKNWKHFSDIFKTKERIRLFLSELNKFRNPEMHSRELLEHQRYLCIGICGELLLAIEKWQEGFTHRVKSHFISLRFSVYVKTDEDAAQLEAKKLADQWLDTVSRKLDLKIQEKRNNKTFREVLIRHRSSHIKANQTWKYRGLHDKYFRSSDINLTSSDLKALDEIIQAGNYPYWHLKYELSEELDLSIIVETTKKKTGKGPGSSASIGVNGGPITLTNVDYYITSNEFESLRLGLSRGSKTSSLSLTYDGDPNKGLWQAHNIFTLKQIFSILYGEVIPGKVNQLFLQACDHQS